MFIFLKKNMNDSRLLTGRAILFQKSESLNFNKLKKLFIYLL